VSVCWQRVSLKALVRALKFAIPVKLAALLICTTMILMPSASRADIVYSFIKVTCKPESKTAILQAYYLENEEGAKAAKTHEKGTYYLDEISGYTEINDEVPLRGEIKACDFGGSQSASFIARKDHEHPRADGLRLFLNNKQVNAWYTLAYGGWTLEIHALGEDQFDLRQCRDEHLPTEPQCGDAHVQDGKIVRTHKNNTH